MCISKQFMVFLLSKFQAAIADEPEPCVANLIDNQESQEPSEDKDLLENSELSEIVGTKCQAPFKFEWGGCQYCNAIIVGVEPMVADSDPMVRHTCCNNLQGLKFDVSSCSLARTAHTN